MKHRHLKTSGLAFAVEAAPIYQMRRMMAISQTDLSRSLIMERYLSDNIFKAVPREKGNFRPQGEMRTLVELLNGALGEPEPPPKKSRKSKKPTKKQAKKDKKKG